MSTTTASNSSSTSAPLLVRFFDPSTQAKDSHGRTLSSILSWPDSALESSHDYIQILFPLPEPSAFASAPKIDKTVYDSFHSRSDLRASLGAAFSRILYFYGLHLDSSTLEVTRASTWTTNSRNWVTRYDHNHLRISRILRSLRVLGLPDQAKAFHTFLSTDLDVVRVVSSKSQMYWRRAAERPLHLPPDEDDEDAEGVAWLRGMEG